MGYTRPVQAIVPYKAKPVEFYKWWIDNEEKVYLTTEEKIKLYDKVYMESPKILTKNHKKLIDKG